MVDEGNNLLGRNIKALRKAYGETQEELAKSLNCSISAISQYESGVRSVDISTLEAIAKHYRIIVDDLMHSDLSGQDKINISFGGVTQVVDMFKRMFPLFCSDKAMNNKSFRKGYDNCSSYLDSITGNGPQIEKMYTDCIDLFFPLKDDFPEAAANMLSMLFYTFCFIHASVNPTYYSSFLYPRKDNAQIKMVLSAFSEESEDVRKRQREFAKNTEEAFYMLVKILKKDLEWCELADYYLAMKYLVGMGNSELSKEMEITVGENMLAVLYQLDNKYVHSLVEIFSKLIEISR